MRLAYFKFVTFGRTKITLLKKKTAGSKHNEKIREKRRDGFSFITTNVERYVCTLYGARDTYFTYVYISMYFGGESATEWRRWDDTPNEKERIKAGKVSKSVNRMRGSEEGEYHRFRLAAFGIPGVFPKRCIIQLFILSQIPAYQLLTFLHSLIEHTIHSWHS